MTKNAVMVSRRAMEGLPPADREALLAAAKRAEERGWGYAREAEDSTQRRLAERGLTIGTLPPDVTAGLNRISATMVEEWVQRAGEDGRKLVDALKAG
jgi:TRAP-type C4-dicarboxylate transport system substrate-binding protein